MRSLTRFAGTMAVATAMLAAAGCQSLDVTNPNDPDALRALSDPAGVEAVQGGTFRTWFNTTQAMESMGPLTTMADSYTASWNNFNMRVYSSQPAGGAAGSQPRSPWLNNPAEVARTTIEWLYYGYYSSLSSSNDVLTAIRTNGLEINTPEETKMVETAAVLMQAMTLSELALHYDKAFVVTESTDLASVAFSPREDVRDTALAKFQDVIALATANDFEFPKEWFNADAGYTNTQIVQLANTMSARLIAYFPRSSAENDDADWAAVADFASKGISSGSAFDFSFKGDGNCPDLTGTRGFCDELKLWGDDPGTVRVDTRVAKMLDPATQTDPWPDPNGNPRPNSPDKRLGDGSFGDQDFADYTTGVPATANAGTDFLWASQAQFRATRGQYHQSNIAHVRYVDASFADPSPFDGGRSVNPVISIGENDLLWAEGLIRSGGSLLTAATKINNTRVTRGGLLPATIADGVSGLLTKLHYEQDVELIGLGASPYFNRRRIDGLQPKTPRQMPVPAKELGVLGLELYTFGGDNAPEFSVSPLTIQARSFVQELERRRPGGSRLR